MTLTTNRPDTAGRPSAEPEGAPAARIERARCSLYFVPLAEPASDAKVFAGRQRPLGSAIRVLRDDQRPTAVTLNPGVDRSIG